MKKQLLSYSLAIVVAGVLTGALPSLAGEGQPAQTQQGGATGQAQGDKPYTVVCEKTQEGPRTCKVDQQTYAGWRTYHAFCYQCHAQDAVGSTFAPNLLDRMKMISKERFYSSVTNGYKGQIGVMPAWKDNPNVMTRIDELYSYLKARSDGALAPGRPERIEGSTTAAR